MANKLLQVFEISAYRIFTAYDLARDMGISDINGQCAMDEALCHLLLKGKIEQVFPGKFQLRSQCQVTGVVDLSLPDKPALIAGSYDRPVYILPDCLRGASHGDTVLVNIRGKTYQYLEAEVLQILKSAERNLVGTLEVSSHRAYFTPINQDLFCEIEIPLEHIKNAVDGDSVVIKFYYYTQRNTRKVAGKVVRVLGEADLKQVKNSTFIQANGFPSEFTPEEEAAAAAINFEIAEAEIANRLDMRGITTFTIDPAGAKNIADAISIRALDNGNVEIGIHIADVSHYIKPGSILDRQAYERTTTVHLADYALPMFPNHFTYRCSFLSGEDKPAFSVILEMNSEAKIMNRKIVKTIIRSQRQFSYEEVQQLIDNPTDEIFSTSMNTLQTLSEKLREKRFKNGAIAFKDHPELRFEYDDDTDQVTGIQHRKKLESMSLVEEFMLLAGRTVATVAAQKHIPMIYRIHGYPKVAMFNELCQVAANYGYTLQVEKNKHSNGSRTISKNISGILSQVKTKQEESLFTYLAIRSMSQGKYSHVPRRHFALAFDHYTHFTAPLCRYADLLVHRMLTRALIVPTESTGVSDYEAACEHFNKMSRKAKMMEQHSNQQKCAEFLSDKMEEILEGTIIYITLDQIVIELSEWGIRGNLLLKSLKDDHYRLDYHTFIVHGVNTGKTYQIGNKIQVQINYLDISHGVINFAPA
jgi:ribonuclease R